MMPRIQRLSSARCTYLIAARNLERIADHAVNIAQDVVFMVEGQVIRHGPKENH